MRKILLTLMIGALFIGAGLAVAAPINNQTHSGGLSATVSGSAPVIDSIGIWDNTAGAWSNVLDVNTEIWIYVNVSDQDTIDNIETIDLSFYDLDYVTSTLSGYHYSFNYTDYNPDDGDVEYTANPGVTGDFAEINPTDFASIVVANLNTPLNVNVNSQNTESYIFSFILDDVAHESFEWTIAATVTDANANTDSVTLISVAEINAYVSMDYTASGGGYDFSWSGAAGDSNLVDTFSVTVTSNDAYSLSAAYAGDWNHTTEPFTYTPNLKVGTTPGSAVAVTAGSYALFYSGTGLNYNAAVTNWNLYLTLPSNMVQGSYAGPTIYIRGTNS